MSNTKELTIHLKEDKIYYPGDRIKGYVIVNPKKTIDVQHILLKFHGCVETYSGDKLALWNEEKQLVMPPKSKRYTTFSSGQVHEYDFEFTIPTDQRLPSYAYIPKVANVAYFLTAIHKRPRLRFSHSLSPVSEEIKILERIDVLSPDYIAPVNMSSELGFTNGSKLSYWSLHLPKSAFIRGDVINLECNIFNFPSMNKPKAVKFSFIRLTHKTNSGKLLEKRTLSYKALDLIISPNRASTCTQQVAIIELNVPTNTCPSIFPDSGRRISISYVIQAELVMKGVKSAIKLKPLYMQEISIVIGTIPTTNTVMNHSNDCGDSILPWDSNIGYGTYNSPFHSISFNNDTININKTLPTKLCRRNTGGNDQRTGSSPGTVASVGVRKQRSQQDYHTTTPIMAVASDSITPLPRLSKTTTTIKSNNSNSNDLNKKCIHPNATAGGRMSCISPLKDSSTTTASSFSSCMLPMTPVSTYHFDMYDYLPAPTSNINATNYSAVDNTNNTSSAFHMQQQIVAPLKASVSTSSYADRSLTPLPALPNRRSSSTYTQQRRGSRNPYLTATKVPTNNTERDHKSEEQLQLSTVEQPQNEHHRLSEALSTSVILSSPNEIGPNDIIVRGEIEKSVAGSGTRHKPDKNDAMSNTLSSYGVEEVDNHAAKTFPTFNVDKEKTLDYLEEAKQLQQDKKDDEAFCKDDHSIMMYKIDHGKLVEPHSSIF